MAASRGDIRALRAAMAAYRPRSGPRVPPSAGSGRDVFRKGPDTVGNLGRLLGDDGATGGERPAGKLPAAETTAETKAERGAGAAPPASPGGQLPAGGKPFRALVAVTAVAQAAVLARDLGAGGDGARLGAAALLTATSFAGAGFLAEVLDYAARRDVASFQPMFSAGAASTVAGVLLSPSLSAFAVPASVLGALLGQAVAFYAVKNESMFAERGKVDREVAVVALPAAVCLGSLSAYAVLPAAADVGDAGLASLGAALLASAAAGAATLKGE